MQLDEGSLTFNANPDEVSEEFKFFLSCRCYYYLTADFQHNKLTGKNAKPLKIPFQLLKSPIYFKLLLV